MLSAAGGRHAGSSGTCLLDAALIDSDLAGGGNDGSPGVSGQRYAVAQALLAQALLGLAGDQHLTAGKRRFGAFEVGNVARHVLREDGLGVDRLGIDVEGEHAIAAKAVLAGAVRTRGLHASERAAEQLNTT